MTSDSLENYSSDNAFHLTQTGGLAQLQVADHHEQFDRSDLIGPESSSVRRNLMGLTACPEPAAMVEKSEEADLLHYSLTDSGNAERLIAREGSTMRFCHAKKSWHRWDGRRWPQDDTHQVRGAAQRMAEDFLNQARISGAEDIVKFATKSLNRGAIAAAVRPDELDRDPFLLNFKNGTVDLRTGDLRAHRREDYITKLIAHDYYRNAQCPFFIAFLNRAMGSETDPERAARLVDYLQRAVGYSLVGVTREKLVFVPFGKPDSGKTTFLSIIMEIVGEYATTIQVTSLMAKRDSNNVSADLADLRGVRFVMTSEPSSDQKLASGTVKRIIQGRANIKAARKYENPIIFPETHTIWMDCNKLPGLSDSDDDAVINRLHPIPFKVQTPIEQIDRELPAKLLAESEGILAWLVEGARLWNESGLNTPPEIMEARNEWRKADPFVKFLGQRCIIGRELTVQGRSAYLEFTRWWSSAGFDEPMMTETAFGRRMTARFEKDHKEIGAVYIGIGLIGGERQ